MNSFLIPQLLNGDVVFVNFYRYLYQAKDDPELVREMLTAFRDGLEFRMQNSVAFFYYQAVMTEERKEFFQYMLTDTEKLFKLSLSSHERLDKIDEDLRYLRRRVKKGRGKRGEKTLMPSAANRILSEIRTKYRKYASYPMFSLGHPAHFSRQIMDRLHTETRRGKWTPVEIVEWVEIVHAFASHEHKRKFCIALLDAFWKNIERLYCDWMEVAEGCLKKIHDEQEDMLFV